MRSEHINSHTDHKVDKTVFAYSSSDSWSVYGLSSGRIFLSSSIAMAAPDATRRHMVHEIASGLSTRVDHAQQVDTASKPASIL